MTLRGLFTIPAGASFLDDLAAGLIRAYPPETLAKTRVYLPTRRACRDLTAAFLRHANGAGLLPQAYALGDVEAEELAFAAVEPALGRIEATLDLPPAIDPLRRQFMLAALAQKRHTAEHGDTLPLAAAIRVAAALSRFLDELQIERVDVARIAAIDPGQYAAHWQAVVQFLKIVLDAWPEILTEADRMDPAARREALLAAQAAVWRATPADAPVVIAGSTGALASTRDLMAAVLAAPQGAVVLPGFEHDQTDAEFRAVLEAPSHPQHAMAAALIDLKVKQDAVEPWPASDFAGARERRRFIQEALRPADSVAGWADLAPGTFLAGRNGIERVDAATDHEEARVIALYLRAFAGHGDAVALATPDRALARRVAVELRRWGIEADDSSGRPLGDMPVGAFLRLVARACRPGAAAVDLLSLLKHPLAAGGGKRAAFRQAARALELKVWRDKKLQRSATSMAAVVGLLNEDPALQAFAQRIQDLTAPLAAFGEDAEAPLAALLTAHIEVAEALAATEAASGAERLWREADGEAAALLLASILEAAPASPALGLDDYPDAFDALIASQPVRPRRSGGGVAILGVLEARLGRYDAIALGGLDEGVWPRKAPTDPWFSRPMRAEIGLSDLERRIGLSAHDFAQLLATPNVLLTRSLRREGAPTKPSRWLARLDAVLAAAQEEPLHADDGRPYRDWAKRLDPILPKIVIPEPAPTPDIAMRPRQLSVTQIKTLRDDPYAIYARHVLGLTALPALDPTPNPADRGAIVHAAFETFLRDWPTSLPADIAAELRQAAATAFGPLADIPTIAAFWRPAFDRAAAWAAETERDHRQALAVTEVLPEVKGAASFAAPAGLFKLTGRADRIDRLASGAVAIADIKTGTAPTIKSIRDGTEPQLPLEAAIVLYGEFGGLSGETTAHLAIWKIGGKGDGKVVKLKEAEVAEALATCWQGMGRLIDAFDDAATPYLSEPRGAVSYSDYRSLARRAEDVEDGA